MTNRGHVVIFRSRVSGCLWNKKTISVKKKTQAKTGIKLSWNKKMFCFLVVFFFSGMKPRAKRAGGQGLRIMSASFIWKKDMAFKPLNSGREENGEHGEELKGWGEVRKLTHREKCLLCTNLHLFIIAPEKYITCQYRLLLKTCELFFFLPTNGSF